MTPISPAASAAHRRRLPLPLLAATALILAPVMVPIPHAAEAAGTNPSPLLQLDGKALAREVQARIPATEQDVEGVFKLRDASGRLETIPAKLETRIDPHGWRNIYKAKLGKNRSEHLTIIHHPNQSPQYILSQMHPEGVTTQVLQGEKAMMPFAGTDFWLADLGLEFLHWPHQQIVEKNVMRKGRPCRVLESRRENSKKAETGYIRVLSWIDVEYGGVIQAEAYDNEGNEIKTFALNRFKKVDGQWRLQEMEMRNTIRGTRTQLELELAVQED